MSKRKCCCCVAWEEQIVCAEKGNRVVHYHLKDGLGNSIRAVVGTERSMRHMSFVATDELLRVYGTGGLINGKKQWRARREVVALLSSLVSNTETDDSKDDPASLKLNVPRTVKPRSSESEIIWLGEAWFCAKQQKRYPSLSIHGSKIAVNKKFLPSDPRGSFDFEVNQKIELLCEDSGIRGCWFRCQVLQRTEKCFQVMYHDLLDADESGKLKEWVPAVKLASLDKLGIRCPGRNTIRPARPKNVVNSNFEVGMPVDAWWCDGWWEGVVTLVDSCQLNNVVIYFPGEDKIMHLQKKYVRRSMDWVGNRWVDLKPKPEILAFLAANPSHHCAL